MGEGGAGWGVLASCLHCSKMSSINLGVLLCGGALEGAGGPRSGSSQMTITHYKENVK